MSFEGIQEECGVFGIIRPATADVARDAYYGLYSLQHRGQQACGIVVNDDGVFQHHRDVGLVGDVFTAERLDGLGHGQIAVGHTRYGTTGAGDRNNAQPLVVNHFKGTMALAHNGNLVNAHELRYQLESSGSIFHTTIDTEVISYMITHERLEAPSIEESVSRAMTKLEGAFSLAIMSPKKLVAARDPRGFRPLCIGTMDDESYVVASETCALDAVGARWLRDVEPGEIIVLERSSDGAIELRSNTEHCGTKPHSMCVFEYIYFARPDSTLDGSSVHFARQRAGKALAEDHPVDADIVIGVPDSGIDAAMGYAQASGIPYDQGFIKNKYIGRTFISPGQGNRERGVRIKLNPIPAVVKGKKVVLVDDSIVRGTTSRRIIKLLRDAGAAQVHMRVSAPPFTHPCHYGTDIDSRENLIACHYSEDEIREQIGADTLGYLSIERARELASDAKVGGVCTSCFDGKYPTKEPQPGPIDRYRVKRTTDEVRYEDPGDLADIKEQLP